MFSGCCGVLPGGTHFSVARRTGCWTLTPKALPMRCPRPKLHPNPRWHTSNTNVGYNGLLPLPQFRTALRSHPVPGLPIAELKPQLRHSQLSLQSILHLSALCRCCFQEPSNQPNPLHANLPVRVGLQGTAILLQLSFSINHALSLIVPWILTIVRHMYINYQHMKSVQKVSSHVLWKIETFIEEDTRYKKHCT